MSDGLSPVERTSMRSSRAFKGTTANPPSRRRVAAVYQSTKFVRVIAL
jgi:hypothetical protein